MNEETRPMRPLTVASHGNTGAGSGAASSALLHGAVIAGGAPQDDVAFEAEEIARWARHDAQVRALACMELHALGADVSHREYIASVRRDLGSDGEAMTFPQHEQVGQGCTPALCTREGWTLRDDGELLRWPREGEQPAASGSYERSVDGQAWEPVGMPDLRRAMASRWIDVTQAIAMLDEGHELPSVAAWYRREPGSPPIAGGAATRDESGTELYPNRCGAHMIESTAQGRCGYCGRHPNDALGQPQIKHAASQGHEEREHAALAAASRAGERQVHPSLTAHSSLVHEPHDGGECARCEQLAADETLQGDRSQLVVCFGQKVCDRRALGYSEASRVCWAHEQPCGVAVCHCPPGKTRHCAVVTNTDEPGYVTGEVERTHCGQPLYGTLSVVVDVDSATKQEWRSNASYCRSCYEEALEARADARVVRTEDDLIGPPRARRLAGGSPGSAQIPGAATEQHPKCRPGTEPEQGRPEMPPTRQP